ncbi:MAG: sulfotransferase domain-containing protein, partial [Candidatus Hodarchaeota archaeon]
QEGKPCNVFQIGEVAYFYYEFEVLQDINVPLGGLNITNKMNIVVHAKNSLQSGVEAPSVVRRGSRVRFRQTMELNLAPGEYTFAVSLATMGAEDYARLHKVDYDYLHSRIRSILRVRQAGQILVKRGLALPFHGYVDLKGDITLSILKRMGDTKSEYKRVKNARRESILLPKNAFYLVSYPRSGNTWLLYSLSMLFKAIRSVARAEFELYPYLYGRVVSDGFYLKSENEIDMSRPLIIKSHETQDIYERLYPKAKCIYIYRDGRDALLSFYFFKKAFSVKEQTILERIGKMQDLASRTSRRVDFDADEFAVFLEKHTPKWANHVKEWLKVDSILAVSYEDLSRCFEGMLREITAYLGIVPSVSISDVKKEYVDGYRSSFSGDSRHFFRKGIVGDWKNYFTEAHVRIFLESGGDLNVKLGYE